MKNCFFDDDYFLELSANQGIFNLSISFYLSSFPIPPYLFCYINSRWQLTKIKPVFILWSYANSVGPDWAAQKAGLYFLPDLGPTS